MCTPAIPSPNQPTFIRHCSRCLSGTTPRPSPKSSSPASVPPFHASLPNAHTTLTAIHQTKPNPSFTALVRIDHRGSLTFRPVLVYHIDWQPLHINQTVHPTPLTHPRRKGTRARRREGLSPHPIPSTWKHLAPPGHHRHRHHRRFARPDPTFSRSSVGIEETQRTPKSKTLDKQISVV